MMEQEWGSMGTRKGNVIVDGFPMLWIDNGIWRGSWHDFSIIVDKIPMRLSRYSRKRRERKFPCQFQNRNIKLDFKEK